MITNRSFGPGSEPDAFRGRRVPSARCWRRSPIVSPAQPHGRQGDHGREPGPRPRRTLSAPGWTWDGGRPVGPKALGSDPLKHFHLEPERQKRRRSKTRVRAFCICPDRRASAPVPADTWPSQDLRGQQEHFKKLWTLVSCEDHRSGAQKEGRQQSPVSVRCGLFQATL